MDAGTQAEPKKYSYKIAEANDAQEGVAYDAHSAWLDVNVWDNGEGTITAQAVYDHEGGKPSATPETFMNKLLHPVELPATGGNGLAVPIAVAVIVATGEGAPHASTSSRIALLRTNQKGACPFDWSRKPKSGKRHLLSELPNRQTLVRKLLYKN